MPAPHGETAQDAFGRIPVFEGKGCMKRAILVLGEQDVDVSAIKPRIAADVLGASSDHLRWKREYWSQEVVPSSIVESWPPLTGMR